MFEFAEISGSFSFLLGNEIGLLALAAFALFAQGSGEMGPPSGLKIGFKIAQLFGLGIGKTFV